MTKAYIKHIGSFMIFGTIGLFARLIPLPSSEVVLARTVIGGAFIFLVMLIRGKRIDIATVKHSLWKLIFAGVMLAISWMTLFEAYKCTQVSTATVVYYLAPVIVMFASPLIFKEKLTIAKIVGITATTGGLVLMCGVGLGGANPVGGLIFALISAVTYAALMIMNKLITGIGGLERTAVQLAIAAALLLPYALISQQGVWIMPEGTALIALLILCIVHTGFACYLYFSSLEYLSAQSAAICSYTDPLCALFLSAAILGERMSALQWTGAVLILGGALLAQLYKQKHPKAVTFHQ